MGGAQEPGVPEHLTPLEGQLAAREAQGDLPEDPQQLGERGGEGAQGEGAGGQAGQGLANQVLPQGKKMERPSGPSGSKCEPGDIASVTQVVGGEGKMLGPWHQGETGGPGLTLTLTLTLAASAASAASAANPNPNPPAHPYLALQ
jgi:hypothetical protein